MNLSKVIGEKKRWRGYKARTKALPENYQTAIAAVERYLMYVSPPDGSDGVRMFEDLLELFEAGAANQTPIREIVGGDPVEFIDAFAANYPEGQWRLRERTRLTEAIDRAAQG